MKPERRLSAVALFTTLIAAAGCSADSSGVAAEQELASRGGVAAASGVQFLCNTGPGSLALDEDLDVDALSLNASLLFAYEHGGASFEPCSQETAMSLEHPKVAGGLGTFLPEVDKALKWLFRTVPATRSTIRASKIIRDSIEIANAMRRVRNLSQFGKAGLNVRSLEVVSSTNVFRLEHPGDLRILVSQFTDDVVVAKATTGVNLGVTEFNAILEGIRSQASNKNILGVVATPMTNRGRALELGNYRKPAGLADGEFIASYEVRVRTFSPEGVVSALDWLGKAGW
jgi:hypothetical protein